MRLFLSFFYKKKKIQFICYHLLVYSWILNVEQRSQFRCQKEFNIPSICETITSVLVLEEFHLNKTIIENEQVNK